MQESELVNHLSDIQDFTSNLENDCKNIKFVNYIAKLIIFHFPIILKSRIDDMKRRGREF